MKIFKNPNYDFVRWTWPALALSWIIILAGGLFVWNKGIPLGVEFSGGTIVVIDFEQPPDLDKIRGGAAGRRRQRRRAELRPRGPAAGHDPGPRRRRGVGRLAERGGRCRRQLDQRGRSRADQRAVLAAEAVELHRQDRNRRTDRRPRSSPGAASSRWSSRSAGSWFTSRCASASVSRSARSWRRSTTC